MSLLLLQSVRLGVQFTDLTPGQLTPYRLDQTWTWSYNRNLVGQDFMPAAFRKEVYELPPIGREPDWRRSWEWSYNLNLIGRDKLPNRQQDWPNPYPVQWYQNWAIWQLGELELAVPFRQLDWPVPLSSEPNPRRSWEYGYIKELIAQDAMPAAFRKEHYDLPPIGREPDPRRSWEWWYNLSLIGQDKLPNRQQDWPNPYPVRWYQNWAVWQLGELELAVPFKQLDWPNPISPEPSPRRSWEWTYNRNLIGRDFITAAYGKEFYDLPPISYEANPRRSWEYWYNLNLIGQDKFPIRQQDWPLPTLVQRLNDYGYVIFFPPTPAQAKPFNQYDWPVPLAYQRLIDYFWSQSPKVPVVVLPFNQSDWPNPRDFFRLVDYFISQSPFPPPAVVVIDLHFKPHLVSMGRMGNLGGLS